jgi:hypothetical protein
MSVDFWKKEIAKITDNGEVLNTNEILGKEKSSNSTLTKDGGAYFTSNGEYLGQVGESTEIRVVDMDAIGVKVPEDYKKRKKIGMAIGVHILVNKGAIEYQTVPVYISYIAPSKMKLSQLLDLSVVIYGEAGMFQGKEVSAKALAHALWNREIKYSKRLAAFIGTRATFEQEEPFVASDSPYGRIYEYYDDGILALNLASTHKMTDNILGDRYPYWYYENVIHGTSVVTDGSDESDAYAKFNRARFSGGIEALFSPSLYSGTAHNSLEEIIKEVLQSRLQIGVTPNPDPNPGADSWDEGDFLPLIQYRSGSNKTIDSEKNLPGIKK